MKNYIKITLSLVLGLMFLESQAQLNPYQSQYYNNRYLANPAMAGIDKGLDINLAYRSQWNDVPGAPVMQNATLDYGFGKMALGLNVNMSRAGLQRETRVMGSYAYHLPLSENNHLHFGLSLGIMNQRLDDSQIIGNTGDTQIGLYQERKTYFDGDFGMAYTGKALTIEAAIPNLKSVLKKDVIKLANVAQFYSAIAYKINLGEASLGMQLEPKVAYRGIQGFDNVLDAGAMLSFANRQVMVTGMYHSNDSATFGLGLNYLQKYLISLSYNTQTAALSQYTSGSFEINLGLKL